MIVLDATKTLGLKSDSPSFITLHAVVSYWAVDALNVWTPQQFEQDYSGASWLADGDHGVLLAPAAAGETRVVENIWLHLLGSLSGGQSLQVVVGAPIGAAASERIFAQFRKPSSGTNLLDPGDTLVMNRQGVWTRQVATNQTLNVGNTFNTH